MYRITKHYHLAIKSKNDQRNFITKLRISFDK